MNPSSARSPWSTNWRSWALLALWPALAAGAVESEFSGTAAWRTAGRLKHLDQLLSNRSTMELDQTWKLGKRWMIEISGKGELEGAWASESEFGGRLAELDSQRFFWRDTYIQFREGPVRIRAGYQQVVWGEAFGSFYADIVNPKDMRELGLGELTDQRLNTPMLNMQFIKQRYSIQAVYILRPEQNLMPIEGSPYLPADLRRLSTNVLIVERESLEKLDRPEYGLRGTAQIGEADFSLFFLDYNDRQPVYFSSIESLTPLVVRLRPEFHRLQSYGTTMSLELGDYLLRSEIVNHNNRTLNTVALNGALSTDIADEWLYVLGLDIPTGPSWHAGVQVAQSFLEDKRYLNRQSSDQTTATLMLQKIFRPNVTVGLLFTQVMDGGGSLTQLSLTKPISRRLEVTLGADMFDGHGDSQMGQFLEASRAYVSLKGFLR